MRTNPYRATTPCVIARRLLSFLTLLTILVQETAISQSNFWQAASIPKWYRHPIWDIVQSPTGGIFALIGYPEYSLVRSTDNGQTWEVVGTGITFFSVGTEKTVLASNSLGHVFVAGGDGLYRSTDNGSSWENIWSNFPPYTVAVDLDGNVFVCAYEGFFKSTDNGTTWTETGVGLPANLAASQIIPSHFSGSIRDVYVRAFSVVYRSTDAGDTFMRLTVNLEDTTIVEIAISPTTGTLFGTLGYGGIIRTTDGGTSWHRVGSFGSPLFSRIGAGTNGYIFAATGNAVWTSASDGIGWSSSPFVSPCISIGSDLDGRVLAGTEDAGIFSSTDHGSSWTSISDQLPGSSNNVTTLAVNHVGVGYAQGTFGTYNSSDHGLTWTRVDSEPFNDIVGVFLTHPNGNLFATQNYLRRSTDDGLIWLQYSWYGGKVTIATDGDILTFSSANGIRRSTDLGTTWQSLFQYGDICFCGERSIGTTANGVILAGVGHYDPRIGTWYTSLISTNDGATWRSTGVSYAMNAMVGSSTGRLFLATSTGVYKSDDLGTTWSPVNGIGTFDTRSIVVNPVGEIFAGTATSGVYHSADEGENWIPLNGGLEDLKINALVLDRFGYLFAAKETDGIFRSVQSTMPTTSTVEGHAIDFGSAHFGSLVVDSFLVRNTGTFPLVITSVSSNSVFKLNPGSATVAVGESLFTRVSFPRDVLGLSAGTIRHYSNSTVALSEIPVTGAATGSLLSCATREISFGTTVSGVRRDTLLSITNLGYRDSLIITYIESTGPAFVFLHPGSLIPPGMTQTDTIAFTPTAPGLYVDTMVIYSNSISSPDSLIVSGWANDNGTSDIPNTYYLSQNYPNPFNPSTTINFGLPVPGRVTLSVISLLGESTVLIDAEFSAGNFEYLWQPATLATGIYFCRIHSGNLVQTRKMLLLQ